MSAEPIREYEVEIYVINARGDFDHSVKRTVRAYTAADAITQTQIGLQPPSRVFNVRPKENPE
jgi:hypothetical protein